MQNFGGKVARGPQMEPLSK